jgi:hypothetical protein
MENLEMSLLSDRVKRILADHHQDGITAEDCLACSSACCSYGGFAILENVLQIYDRYTAGLLERMDYKYEKNLSFRDFVFTYFDVVRRDTGHWFWKRDVLVFYMKSLSDDGHLITVPGGSYFYGMRLAWFEANPWMNKGCVFLSQKVPNWPEDDGIKERHCILHDPQSDSHLTAKPIDCVFFTCDKPIYARIPDLKISRRWFRALALDYPNSVQRFDALIAADEAKGDTSSD